MSVVMRSCVTTVMHCARKCSCCNVPVSKIDRMRISVSRYLLFSSMRCDVLVFAMQINASRNVLVPGNTASQVRLLSYDVTCSSSVRCHVSFFRTFRCVICPCDLVRVICPRDLVRVICPCDL